jgi:glycosyltransferase involved in cell wall biosynthesis
MESQTRYPLVSICITSYNYGRYIADAIESALAQTYPNVEVVVSENCSTDDTLSVLERYAEEPRVRIFRNARTVGMVQNHNLVLQEARGEYIVLLSADDLLFPTHVSTLARRALEVDDPLDVVYGNAIFLDAGLNPLHVRLYYGALLVGYSGRDGFANMLCNYYLALPAKLIARKVFETIGFFDEAIQRAFDVDFTVRMELSEVRIGHVADVVAGLREHADRAGGVAWQNSEAYILDKLAYLEKFIKPEYAWRFSGSEALLHSVLSGEAEYVKSSQGRPLEPTLQTRLDGLLDKLAHLQSVRPAWPAHRPRISVIVTSDGYIPLLNLTLSSLALSRYTDFEVIVCQGGGNPIAPWLRSLKLSQPVRYLDVKPLCDWRKARLAAIEIARGEHVTMLAEGEAALPHHLERLLSAIDSGSFEVALCDRASLLDHGNRLPFDAERRTHCFEEPFVRAERLKESAHSRLSTVMHLKAISRRNPMAEELLLNLSEEETVSYLTRHHPSISVFEEDPKLAKRELPTLTYDSSEASAQREAFHRGCAERVAQARERFLGG